MNRYLVDYARLQFDCMTLVESDYMARLRLNILILKKVGKSPLAGFIDPW